MKKLICLFYLITLVTVYSCENNKSDNSNQNTSFRKGTDKESKITPDSSVRYHLSTIIDDEAQNNRNFSAAFDSKGYLWLGKSNSLVRYNGYEFKKYSYHPYINNGIPAGEINKIQIDKNDKIWFLSSGFVYRFDPINEIIDVPSLRKEIVNDIILRNDSLFLFDRYGIAIYDHRGEFITGHTSQMKNKYFISKKLKKEILSNNQISLDKIGDFKDTLKSFITKTRTKFIVIHTFETSGELADFGNILNEKDSVIYHKSDSTFWNGGDFKNRIVIDTLTLNKGKYKLYYHTDDSHSWGNWNAGEPDFIMMHGIKLIPYSGEFEKIQPQLKTTRFKDNGGVRFRLKNSDVFYNDFGQQMFKYNLNSQETETISSGVIQKQKDSLISSFGKEFLSGYVTYTYHMDKLLAFVINIRLKDKNSHNFSFIKFNEKIYPFKGSIQIFESKNHCFLLRKEGANNQVYQLNFDNNNLLFQELFSTDIAALEQTYEILMDKSRNMYMFNYSGIKKLSKNRFSTFLKNDGSNVKYGRMAGTTTGIGNSIPSVKPLLDHESGDFYINKFTLSKFNLITKKFTHFSKDSVAKKIKSDKRHIKNEEYWLKELKKGYDETSKIETEIEHQISDRLFKNKYGIYFVFSNHYILTEPNGDGFGVKYAPYDYLVKFDKDGQLKPIYDFILYDAVLVDDSKNDQLICYKKDTIIEIFDTFCKYTKIHKPDVLYSTYNKKLNGYLLQFNGGFGIYQNSKFDTLYYESDTSNYSSGSNVCEYKNKIWLTTRKYLFSIDPETKKVEKLNLFNVKLEKDKVRETFLVTNEFFDKYDLFFYKNQALISTQNSGLWIYDFRTNKWKTIGLADGLLDDKIVKSHLIKNEIWLTFVHGISVVNLNSFDIRNYQLDSPNSGEVGFLCENIWEQNFYYKNMILIPGDHGHHVFNLNGLNKIAPKVQLEQLIINDSINVSNSILFKTHKLTIDQFENNLSGNFTGLEFTNAKQNKYAYRLKGFNNNWKVVGSQERHFEFTNIPPGNYVLEIMASNSDGYWSDPYLLEIEIRPPFWQTIWFRILIGLIIVAILFLLYRWRTSAMRNRQKQLENTIHDRTREVVHQKELIEEKQKEITDSINYAKRIQYSLLAHDDLLKNNLPEHFILFKPKDIVSGDFYWASEKSNNNSKKFYLAVCDSTGHGVPGAFMSLLNISFLNEAINEKNITEPNKVFDHVRNRLTENVDGGADGMDAILIQFDFENKIMNYTAANNAPLLIRDNTIQELQKDKMPVGRSDKTNPFQLFNLTLEKGDCLYFYTDGYADQFGGEKGKKFKYANLNKLLMEIHQLPLLEQNEKLLIAFEKWRGDLEQVDDVCIIGIKI